MDIVVWVVLGLVVLTIVAGVVIFNRLVGLRNRYRNAFARSTSSSSAATTSSRTSSRWPRAT